MVLEEYEFLNQFRHPDYPDDVRVILVKEGLEPEACQTHLEARDGEVLVGILANEPKQNFGYHKGERIAFFLYTDDKGVQVLISDMNPSMKLTPEDLEDGSMLRNAISVFNKDRTEGNFIDVLEILRDSLVWIPCNVVMGEADQKIFENMTDEAAENLVGKTFTAQDDIRMIPDVLRNGDNFFFPVFSTVEEMGDYGNDFSKVQKHFLEAIALANGNEKDVVGIVINAFSEPMVIDKDLFDMIWNMKSRLC